MQLQNKRGLYNYDVLEKVQAGIVLKGIEVKAIRKGRVSFTDSSYCSFIGNELFLENVSITLNTIDSRKKKLLLKRRELDVLQSKVNEKGLTIVPISIYTSDNLIKIDIALCRGRNNVNKKRLLKIRDINRDVQRELKCYKR